MSDEERMDPVVARLAAELRRPVASDPAARDRVMAAVLEMPPVRRRPRAVLEWLTRPRPVMVSPIAGLALASGLALVMVLSRDRSGGDAAVPPTAAALPADAGAAVVPAGSGRAARQVQFVLVAPSASTVALVGSFNDWDDRATPLRPTATDGIWSVTVPLPDGRHVYAFVVDGSEWVADPAAPQAPDDDFGSPNSVIMIGASST